MLRVGLVGLAAFFIAVPVKLSAQQTKAVLDRYCATCHNERLKTGGLSLAQVDLSRPGAQPELWEKVVRKLHTGVMPPPNMPQPSEADRLAMLTWLETSLDAASAAKPNPGRTETLRRLNRTEYQNAIRDLLALDIDAASLLPADESGHGFDNVIVGDLSPTLLNRYISAAQKISRLAVGSTQSSLQSDTISLPADLTQEDQLPGLPIGTRGGMSTSYTFAQDGEYEIQILLDARSGRNRQRVARGPSARDAGAARPGAGQDLHDHESSQRRRHAERKGLESAHYREGRSAQHRRHLRQGRLIADRDAPAADRISLQRPATSAYGARHRPGFGDRTLCAKRRRGHTEPPPIVCMPANRTRQSTGRKVRRRRFYRR